MTSISRRTFSPSALQKSLNATVFDVQWVVESYALFLAALLLAGGSLGDRFGRRRIFCSGVALFALAVACHAICRKLSRYLTRLKSMIPFVQAGFPSSVTLFDKGNLGARKRAQCAFLGGG